MPTWKKYWETQIVRTVPEAIRVVVWALKEPANAANAERALLQEAGILPSLRGNIDFIYGVEALARYLINAGFE